MDSSANLPQREPWRRAWRVWHSDFAMDAVDDFEAALALCGVTETTLSDPEKAALSEAGHVILREVVGPTDLVRMREAFERALGPAPDAAVRKPTGTRHADVLAGGDPVFDVVTTHPRVLAAVRAVLERAFKVFQMSGRDPLPGYGAQGLHADWIPRAPGEPYSVVTTIWLLDDFTEANGATRLVPGSHRDPRPVPKSMAAPASRHPDEVLAVAPAGSVLVFNGHLWHSGTRNGGTGPRRVLQCQFVARDSVRPGEPPDVPERLGPAARYWLGA